jgi:HK97 family phage portal protein
MSTLKASKNKDMWPFGRRNRVEPIASAAMSVAETKASAVASIIVQRALGLPQWPERNFDQAAKEGYRQNPIVYACVWFIAKAAANIPLAIMRGEGEVEVPALRALLDRPNPMQDGESFRQAMISDLLLAGECFSERVDVGRAPRELYRWQPGRVAVVPGAQGTPQAYIYKANGAERRLDVDLKAGKIPVLHIKDYHPTNAWRGMSAVDPAAFSIDVHTNALRWNEALLRNSAQPSGALQYEPPAGVEPQLTEEQFERQKRELEETFAGPKNAGRPLLLEGYLRWVQMSLSPKDMDFAELKNSAAREIALCFGVPPLMLGVPGDNTFANYTEANKAFYRQTVIPLVSQWCRAMSWWIGPAFGQDIRIEPNTDALEVFADEREKEWSRVERTTTLTINEKRRLQGEKPVPGGDVILVSSSMIPLSLAGGELEGGAAPADDVGDSDDALGELGDVEDN